MLMCRYVVWIFSVGLMVMDSGIVFGQDYPNKPIHIVAGAAGGGGDFVSRQVAQGISGPLGQPVIVDNRVALISAETVAKAAPDGYTLLVQGGTLWITPLLRKVPYNGMNDFSPIELISRDVSVLVVHPSVPVKSVKELIALAKARPGELNYAMTSIGGSAHLASELFKSMAGGVNIVNVPFKGDALAITALLSGEVQMAIYDKGLVAPHVKSGKLKALAVTSAEPSILVPGLPSVAASGLPGFEAVGISAIFAPAKTPAPIINRLNQEIMRVLARSDVKENFLKFGSEIVGGSPEQLAAAIKTEVAKWSKVIKDAGIGAN